MEGLEISVVKLSEVLEDVDLRLESEYYNSEHIVFNSVQGCDIESFSQYGTSEDLNEEGKGFPILRLNEFDSFFISKPSKYCDLISKETFELLKLKKNDVLICRTNGNPKYVGKAAIVPKNYEYAFASYVFRLRPKTDIINSATLVSFLNSKYGRIEIEKYSMVGNQANFSPAKFRQIAIPILSKELNNKIEEIVYKSFELLEESKSLYSQAEDLLLGELGLKDWQPKNTLHTTKKFSDFAQSGRLDAEYYQPKYDEIEKELSRFEQIKIKDFINYPVSSGSTPKAGDSQYYADCNDGIPFLRAVDIVESRIDTNDLIYIKKDVHNGLLKRTQLKKGDVLFSIAGTVGRCGIFDYDFEANINQAIAILRFEETKLKHLYVVQFFNSRIGQLIIQKYARQGLQTNLNLDELSNLSIPILPEAIQTKIASLIQQSFECKAQSKQLLEDAKRMVEAEIEKN